MRFSFRLNSIHHSDIVGSATIRKRSFRKGFTWIHLEKDLFTWIIRDVWHHLDFTFSDEFKNLKKAGTKSMIFGYQSKHFWTIPTRLFIIFIWLFKITVKFKINFYFFVVNSIEPIFSYFLAIFISNATFSWFINIPFFRLLKQFWTTSYKQEIFF